MYWPGAVPRYTLYPWTEDVLGLQPRLTWGSVPVPCRGSDAEALVALLEKERLPEAVPLACGANDTLSCTLLPAVIVTGKVAPGSANWELLLAAEEIVTLPPVAVNTAGCVALSPTITLPKCIDVGVMLRVPTVAVAPVPVKGRFSDGPAT